MIKSKKRLGFIGLTIAMFMGTLDSTIVNIALPKLMTTFNTNLAGVSWVATTYTLALAVFMITATKLGDKFGRKKIMITGLLLFTGASAACMFAPSLMYLLVFRSFQGLGGAIITPLVLPMGVELFGKQHMSKIAAIVGAITALAAAGGPAAGGFILEYMSWHWIFGLNVPIGLLSLLLVLFFTKDSFDETLVGHFDIAGMFFLTISLTGITFALLEGREYGWTSALILSSLLTGIIGLIVFILIELKVSSPIVELNLFREKTFTSSCIIYFATGFALVAPAVIFNYYLQNVLNYDALHAALMIIPVSLAIAITMPLATRLSDKVSAIPVNLIGMILIAGSLLLFSLITTTTPKMIMIVCSILIGSGFGFSTVSFVSSVRHLPKSKTGIGSGITNASRQIGTCLGMAVLVTVLNANISTAKSHIQHHSVAIINRKNLSPNVKKTAKSGIKQIFSSNDQKNINYTSQQKHFTKQLKQAALNKSNLPQPKKDTNYRKLYDATLKISEANQRINDSLYKLVSATTTNQVLNSQIMSLSDGNLTLLHAQKRIPEAIKLLAQRDELKRTLSEIKKEKNTSLSHAFSKTYVICALLLLVCSPIALLSDKHQKKTH
ncbi:DHA2 family efflux MFS transporter permease subunit [Leuconostoc koreense]|nr:DHA2 family efflux MFS transporter permease subunit [Leuconostoc mesenteroides]QGM25274.1 DHA2 family efflux MFS transporter permease subunit [Leuconostoc mesenteroides subsp. mesenteroides]